MTVELSPAQAQLNISRFPARHLGNRLIAMLQRWSARRADALLARRVRAETRDPAVLEELGIAPVRPNDVERWIMAMLQHQQ